MVRYLFYTIGDLTYQSPLVTFRKLAVLATSGKGHGKEITKKALKHKSALLGLLNYKEWGWRLAQCDGSSTAHFIFVFPFMF